MKYALLIYAAEKDWTLRSEEEQSNIYRYERTPVIELNRAVAVSFAAGPLEGLALLDGVERAGSLEQYAPLYLARADMLRRLGRNLEARAAYQRALPFAQNEQVRRFIEQRMQEGSHVGLRRAR